MNVKLKVGEPTSLAMLELVTKLRMPFATCEPIECLSEVLDGIPITCGSRIGKRFYVVFKVSFSTAIVSLVFSLKS